MGIIEQIEQREGAMTVEELALMLNCSSETLYRSIKKESCLRSVSAASYGFAPKQSRNGSALATFNKKTGRPKTALNRVHSSRYFAHE